MIFRRKTRRMSPPGGFASPSSPKFTSGHDARAILRDAPSGSDVHMPYAMDKRLAAGSRQQVAGNKPPVADNTPARAADSRCSGKAAADTVGNMLKSCMNNSRRLAHGHPRLRQSGRPRPRQRALYQPWPIPGRQRGRIVSWHLRARRSPFPSESFFSY